MIIDFCVEYLQDFDEDLDWLEEELKTHKNDIKEDLSIQIYGTFKVGNNEYKNFEIIDWIDEDDDIEDEIDKVLDKVLELFEKVKKDEYFEKEQEIF